MIIILQGNVIIVTLYFRGVGGLYAYFLNKMCMYFILEL